MMQQKRNHGLKGQEKEETIRDI